MTHFIMSFDTVHLNSLHSYSSFTPSRCASPLEVQGDVARPLDRTLLPVADCFEAISASSRHGASQYTHLDHHLSNFKVTSPFFISRLDAGRVLINSACLPWGLPIIAAIITPQRYDYDPRTEYLWEDLSHSSPPPSSFVQLQDTDHYTISTMSSMEDAKDTEDGSSRRSSEDDSSHLSKEEHEPLSNAFAASKLKSDGFVSHLIKTQDAASNFVNAKQKLAVSLILLTLGVRDGEDVADIEPGSIMMAYHDSLSITMLVVTRATRFFMTNLHPNFPDVPVATETPAKPVSSRKGRKSGLLHPTDFLVMEPLSEHHDPSSTPVRYVGGNSSRQQVSDDYAASGGGVGGLGKGISIHQALSSNAVEIRDKYRLKMATSVLLVLPVWDGSVEGWYSFSKKFILHMKKVGYEIVCRPGFVATAQELKWSPEEIVEAKSFVWDQLLAAVQASESASNALAMAGAEHDGETCFHQLELDNKASGHALEIKLRNELLHLKPLSREDPIAMITRFDVLLNKYLDLENSEIWNPERKIRTVLELFRLWEDLKVTVDTIRFAMTDPSAVLVDHISNDDLTNPHLFSCAKICRRAKAVWKSYASSDKDVRLKINRGAAQESSSTDDNPSTDIKVDLNSQFADILAGVVDSIKVLTNKVESRHNPGKPGGKGNGKPSKREPLVKQKQNCLNPRCKLPFEGYACQHACNECFQTAKTDRQALQLQGSRDGADYSGKSFTIIDSTDRRCAKRGGWKIDIRSFRLSPLVPDFGVRMQMDFAGTHSSSACSVPPSGTSVPVLSQRLTTDVIYGHKFFFGTGSCGGVGATGIDALFHDEITPLQWVIEGMKSGDEALVPVNGCGVAALLAQDKDSKEELILLYGGMLKCPATQVTSTVGSSSQVGNFFNSSQGRKGAQFHTANPDNAFMQLPDGHSIALHVNDDGAFGCLLSTINPNDPRMRSCKKIWISEDCVQTTGIIRSVSYPN
jgi:hypothetical protein